MLIGRVLENTVEYDFEDRAARRFGPGDVYLVSKPDRPILVRSHGLKVQAAQLDLSLLGKVTGESPAEVVHRFRTEALPQPQARTWQRAINHLTDVVLTDDVAMRSPLILGAAGRLLTSTLLAAFDPTEAPETTNDRLDGRPDALHRAVAYIDANPDLDITLRDIAAAARTTPRAVQYAFRSHLGTTPVAYLRQVRLDAAHRDLRAADPTTGDTVTTIAARWGFAHPGRFAALYRQTYGQPPRTTLHS